MTALWRPGMVEQHGRGLPGVARSFWIFGCLLMMMSTMTVTVMMVLPPPTILMTTIGQVDFSWMTNDDDD